jgi:hypothetical protein
MHAPEMERWGSLPVGETKEQVVVFRDLGSRQFAKEKQHGTEL